jgi:acyl phosphate:glycerol-3-phosphate acyltransferase
MPEPIITQVPFDLFLVALAFGYLLGSIPFGLILTRLAGLGDVRNIGSGNIGATNVLRTGNKKLAAATLIGDALKGTLAVVVAAQFSEILAIIAGFGAFIGHLFPVWLKFRGGKGVATYVGVLLGLAPAMVLIFAVIWIGTAYFTRYSSLAALLAAIVVPLSFFILGEMRLMELFVIMSIITFIKHRANIGRLINGTESRIGARG